MKTSSELTKKPSKFQQYKMKLLLILSVIGPGIIAGTADNDAGGITTYTVVGSFFGYQMLWIVFIVICILIVTQEMGARLGLVTGKGLSALIRENFNLKITVLIVSLTFIANLANILAEYAGISAVADLYGVPRYIAVLLTSIAIWAIVYKGSFKIVQKVFLTSALLFFAYVIAGIIAKPDWNAALRGTFIPTIQLNTTFFYTAVALIGTTITAWGQFFVQSYFVDKGVGAEHLKYSRMDISLGALWTGVVAFFIVLATAATLFKAGIQIEDAAQAAQALEPFAGAFAKHLFAWGLLNASLLGLAVIAMTSSYLITEAFGLEGRVDLKKESPTFYKIFTFSVFFPAILILLPNLPLVPIIVGSQMANTFVLPIIFIAIIKLLNDSEIMGKYKNKLFGNILSWISVIFIVAMATTLVVMTFVVF